VEELVHRCLLREAVVHVMVLLDVHADVRQQAWLDEDDAGEQLIGLHAAIHAAIGADHIEHDSAAAIAIGQRAVRTALEILGARKDLLEQGSAMGMRVRADLQAMVDAHQPRQVGQVFELVVGVAAAVAYHDQAHLAGPVCAQQFVHRR
ncbi:hypothetical protein CQR43_14390, partial [Enterococcus faecium]